MAPGRDNTRRERRNPPAHKEVEKKSCARGRGTEQNGDDKKFLRPALILRGFGADACLVAPLTTSTRKHPLRVAVGLVDGREARANLSQIRVVDTRRLVEKIGFLEKEIFVGIRKAARGLL